LPARVHDLLEDGEQVEGRAGEPVDARHCHDVAGAEVRALNAVLKEADPGLSGTVFGLSKAEAVCMGGIVRNEVIVKFDLRKTHPGGDDLGKDWAKRTVSSGPRAVAAD
jgi:hypothetical protein